jgi:hypothetical protein
MAKKFGDFVAQATPQWAKFDDDTEVRIGDEIELPETVGATLVNPWGDKIAILSAIEMVLDLQSENVFFNFIVVDVNGVKQTYVIPSYENE